MTTTLQIPCETYARLARIALSPRHDMNDWFRSLRYDNGVIVASNRAVLAVERITGPAGAFHIIADAALLAQCQTEAPSQSVLTVNVTEMLGWAEASTTLGYRYPGNAYVKATGENKLADWRSIVPAGMSSRDKGPLFFDADLIALLGSSSPSGRIVFEQHIDIDKPMMVRDAYEDSWIGFFIARSYSLDGMSHEAAAVPAWLKDVCK